MAVVDLTQGQQALVDDADAELIVEYRWMAAWYANIGAFYAVARIRRPDGNRATLLMHRLITSAQPGQRVDHANHNHLDNRRQNLRLCSNAENLRNRRSVRRGNTTGFLGVYKAGRRWRAGVGVDGRYHYTGHFDTAYEAALARDQLIRERFPSEFWTFNVPLLPGERGIQAAS